MKKQRPLNEKKKSVAERMKDGYGSGWPEHRSSDRKKHDAKPKNDSKTVWWGAKEWKESSKRIAKQS